MVLEWELVPDEVLRERYRDKRPLFRSREHAEMWFQAFLYSETPQFAQELDYDLRHAPKETEEESKLRWERWQQEQSVQ